MTNTIIYKRIAKRFQKLGADRDVAFLMDVAAQLQKQGLSPQDVADIDGPDALKAVATAVSAARLPDLIALDSEWARVMSYVQVIRYKRGKMNKQAKKRSGAKNAKSLTTPQFRRILVIH